MENPTLVSIGGKPITHNDILIHLKEQGIYKNTVQELLKIRAIQVYAEQNKLEVEGEELQAYVNEKRKTMGLTSSEATQKYLNSLGITPDQWIDSIEYEMLEDKVKKQVITDDRVEEYYRQNKLQFLKIDLFKITIEKESEAEEILMEIRDDGRGFSELARKYSIDQTSKNASGFVGTISRGQLGVELEQRIFTANENDLIGPIKEADQFSIYKVGDKHQSEFDDTMKDNISNSLFAMWQNQLIQSMKIEVGEKE